MLASAGAAKAQGAADKFVIQVFCNLSLFWNFRVDQIAKVKIAITDVSDQKVRQTTGFSFGHRVKQAVCQLADGHASVGADGSAARPALQRCKISIVTRRPKASSLLWRGGPFKCIAALVAGNFLNRFGLLFHARWRSMKLHQQHGLFTQAQLGISVHHANGVVID